MSKSEGYVRQTCVEVTGGGTQTTCPSSTVAITGITTGTIKVPVVLTEVDVQVNVDSVITLPEPALEVKQIKKRLKVTQCLLIQDPDVASPTSGTLFLKGFVRKNIDYATRACSNTEGVCGDIRHCTVDVPWNCTTTVFFDTGAGGTTPEVPPVNQRDEFEFFRRQSLPTGAGFAEKDQLLSGDFSEFNQVSQEFFTELPYCELIFARIVEYDEFLNRTRPNVAIPFEEREFTQLEEKMVITVRLKVLQNRQVTL